MHHLGHLRHRVTAGKTLPEPGADQQVAGLDVGGLGHVAQLEVVGVAGSHRNGAQAVAVDLDRNAVGDVGQQQDPRGVRQHFDHLPHQAAGIEHRLPHEHAVLLALVDQDAVGEGVGVQADQLGNQHPVVDQCRGVEQLAQAHVLFGERGQLLQPPLHQQRLGLEPLVLCHQAVAGGYLGRCPAPDTHRHIGDPVERRQHQAHLAADGLQRVEAGIHHHQHDTKHDEHQQAYAEHGSFGK